MQMYIGHYDKCSIYEAACSKRLCNNVKLIVETHHWCASTNFRYFGLNFNYLFCRVNKPYLPIAAGDLSVQSAWLLVIFFAIAGLLVVGFNFGPFITSLYSLGLFLGTIYSVPPLRMKRFPIAAFLIIATVKAVLCFSICIQLSTWLGKS